MAGLGSSAIATHASNHFGLGGRPDDVAPADPVAWLRAQLRNPDPVVATGFPTTSDGIDLGNRLFKATAGSTAQDAAHAELNALFARECQALLGGAVTTQAPFRERLVWFWMNHLAVMAATVRTSATAGAYVREAIRPNVTGRYADMLAAAILHPAMLYSLNNDQSVGPASPRAVECLQRTGIQLDVNENLARETLELYTVGVGAGYSQADVRALAHLLTGCTVNTSAAPYGFVYDARSAQPGSQTLMGNSYPNTLAGLRAALLWLGTHAATYLHLATKLVTHFVSDSPDPRDVAVVCKALASSGGDLSAAAAATVGLPGAWVPLTKLRTPVEYVVAALRGLGATADAVPNLAAVPAAMGQSLWSPPFPNGWSDLAADWLGPESLLIRGDWANVVAWLRPQVTASGFAAAALGPLLGKNTVQVANNAQAGHDQIALLLTSPEFQRR